MASPAEIAARIRLKRAYDPAEEGDGRRILVDRLWPRGVTKEGARLFAWRREIAPSDALRRWLHADPTRWEGFVARYRAELATRADLVDELVGLAGQGVLTLVYAAKDAEQNNAAVLRDYLCARVAAAGSGDG